MCLVCGRTFQRRSDMIKHAHCHTAQLSRDLPCPQYGHITSSPSEFSNHVERAHGKQYAPNFTTVPKSNPDIPCGICLRDVGVGRILGYFNSKHAGYPHISRKSLICAACPDKSELDIDA